jgi:starch-binding outer membrane protein SusE/F
MKKIILSASIILLLIVGCKKEYTYDPSFTVPSGMIGPSTDTTIVIPANQAGNLKFQWQSGVANDGGILIYEVLMDKTGGDFSNPFLKKVSDKGGSKTYYTMTIKSLNQALAALGVASGETTEIIWSVTASKGGTIERVNEVRKMTIKRP